MTTTTKLTASDIGIIRTVKNNGSLPRTYDDFYLGTEMNLDIYLGISYGQYSNHNKDNEALFEPYSDKEMRSYNPSLGGFDLHYSTNTSMGWTFIEVSLYAFANGVQIGEPKFMPPIEAGYCPSVNLIDTGEQSLLKVIPAVEQFVADNTSAITKFAEDKHAEAITFLKDTLEKIS